MSVTLSRKARHYERRLLRCAIEHTPIEVSDGVATVVCNSSLLVRVAKKDGFEVVDSAPPPEPEPAPEVRDLHAEVRQIVQGTVDEIEDALDTGEYDTVLDYFLEQEKLNKDRITAATAIEERIEDLS